MKKRPNNVDTMQVSLSFPKEILALIDKQALQESRNRSEMIRTMAEHYLKVNGPIYGSQK